MVIENKTELLWLLTALENLSELILQDERAQEWQKRVFMTLLNKIKDECDELNANDEIIY